MPPRWFVFISNKDPISKRKRQAVEERQQHIEEKLNKLGRNLHTNVNYEKGSGSDPDTERKVKNDRTNSDDVFEKDDTVNLKMAQFNSMTNKLLKTANFINLDAQSRKKVLNCLEFHKTLIFLTFLNSLQAY